MPGTPSPEILISLVWDVTCKVLMPWFPRPFVSLAFGKQKSQAWVSPLAASVTSLPMMLCTSGENNAIANPDALLHDKFPVSDQQGPQMFLTVLIQGLIQFIYCHAPFLSHIWALSSSLISHNFFSSSLHTLKSISVVLSLGQVCPPRDIWQCLETNGDRYLCYGHLVGRGQGWCWTSYKAQEPPHNKGLFQQNVTRNISTSTPPSSTQQMTTLEFRREKTACHPLQPQPHISFP